VPDNQCPLFHWNARRSSSPELALDLALNLAPDLDLGQNIVDRVRDATPHDHCICELFLRSRRVLDVCDEMSFAIPDYWTRPTKDPQGLVPLGRGPERIACYFEGPFGRIGHFRTESDRLFYTPTRDQ